MNVTFSIYHKLTKGPLDKSHICTFNWDNVNDNETVKPTSTVAPGRVSGLYKHKDTIWCCVGIGFTKFDYKKREFGRLRTNKLINQSHSLFANSKKVYLTSTGLDLLLIFDHDGNLINSWNPTHGINSKVFKNYDYRMINYHTTGFNIKHVNHVICNNDYIFVNCGKDGSIYQLNHDLNIVKIKKFDTYDSNSYITHDGLIEDDWITFTESNGYLWKWNYLTDETVSLKINGQCQWLRGLTLYNDTYFAGVSSSDDSVPSKIIQFDKQGNLIKSVHLQCKFNPPMVYSIIVHD